jgi:hypothetical protein
MRLKNYLTEQADPTFVYLLSIVMGGLLGLAISREAQDIYQRIKVKVQNYFYSKRGEEIVEKLRADETFQGLLKKYAEKYTQKQGAWADYSMLSYNIKRAVERRLDDDEKKYLYFILGKIREEDLDALTRTGKKK